MKIDIATISLVIGIISGVVVITIPFFKANSRKKEENKKIYADFFGEYYSLLFEYERTNERPNIRFHSNNFNPIEISSFCNKVVRFKNKGNKFKGICTRIRFNKLFNIAKTLDEKTDDKWFGIKSFIDEDETYLKYYQDNEQDFIRLKERFKKFYLKIYPVLN